jgi:thiol-disulfide isomerase/thioredoxin
MAWGAVDGLDNGLLLLTAEPSLNGTVNTPTFVSNGFSAERVQELTSKVVPGSGLPYVLPDDGVTLLGVGSEGAGRLVSQTYSNDRGVVTVAVGDYRGQLTPLVTYGFHTVLIPSFGVNGYRSDLEGGGAYVVWQMPDGQWATLDIPPALADRVDGLIAALGPADTPVTEEAVYTTSTVVATTLVGPIGTIVLDTLIGDALPPYSSEGSETAVGLPAPQFGTEGTVAAPVAGVRTLVVFTAPWCPHCKKVLPIVIGAETEGLPGVIADNAGGGTKVAIVETASSPGDEIYTLDDFVAWGHVGPIYLDTDAGVGSPGDVATAYGVTGFPYFVLVDADGTVLRRTEGEMSEADFLTFVNG